MRRLFALVFTLIVAACGSLSVVPASGLLLTGVGSDYTRGEWVNAVVRNHTARAVEFWYCPRPLERWSGSQWEQIPPEPPPESGGLHLTDVCTTGLHVLLRGGTAPIRVQIPQHAGPGRHRLLVWWRPHEAEMQQDTRTSFSGPFEVHR